MRCTPDCALDITAASLAPNTIKQYNTCYQKWWKYCLENHIDFYNTTVSNIITFLTHNFNQGASYGTLNSHRSALSLLLGNHVGTDENIKRFFKGVFKKKPPLPKYSETWDPAIVLDYIANWYPHENLKLEQLTKKVVILLALCTAHRSQTLSLIALEDINVTDSGVNIKIQNRIKTSAIGRNQPHLFLPFFRDKPQVCPATAIIDYRNVTKNYRTIDMANLIMTFKRPYKKATSQTISRWIKDILTESGINTSIFKAHSTRHASTSAASRRGINIDLIRKTAGWSDKSATFARFYNRPVIQKDSFARAVFQSNL